MTFESKWKDFHWIKCNWYVAYCKLGVILSQLNFRASAQQPDNISLCASRDLPRRNIPLSAVRELPRSRFLATVATRKIQCRNNIICCTVAPVQQVIGQSCFTVASMQEHYIVCCTGSCRAAGYWSQLLRGGFHAGTFNYLLHGKLPRSRLLATVASR